ncbi:MAG: hypothetical protein J5I93_27500 [Pirellulaceae bacterium]|nr:hypothetical protein [Pirellulaceae bacterium]
MQTYAISVKRSQRDAMTIEADDLAIRQVVALLSPACHIEGQIRHRPQAVY